MFVICVLNDFSLSKTMNNFIYKYGGTEGYTANLIEVLQNLYPDSQISIITELHKKRDRVDIDDFLADQNKTYGLNISKKNVSLHYIKIPETNVMLSPLSRHFFPKITN